MRTNKIIFRLGFVLILFSVNINSLFSQVYFQQQVNYKINVKLNDAKHTLKAFEEIEYINNSPDVLNEIWFHLWPNAYSNNSSALIKQQVENGNLKLYFANPDERGYIDSLDFKVNGTSVDFEFKEIDYGKIILPQPLLPNQKVVITTPFFVKIPNARYSRMGHDKQAYYISQWYPKPAVYDKLGWHPIPYLDMGEFFSEFGSFTVSIELPKNYVVAATGELLNDSTEENWLTKKAEETTSLISFSKDMSFPASDTSLKTLTYYQSDVHDFAWFADKRWHVLKGSVDLPNSKRKVRTWSMFTNDHPEWWKKSIEYINNAVYDYSLWNGDYLYNACAVVDGVISAGIGMEYPMVTIVGGESDSLMLDETIAHEVGHNWFYGMLASNERDHPWMDEGINSFYEMRYMFKHYPIVEFGKLNEFMTIGHRLSKWFGLDNLDFKEALQIEYDLTAAMHSDQPINTSAPSFSENNYGIIVYGKSGISFQYLRSYLGDSLFDNCMQEYFNAWKLKHPSPNDFQAVFQTVSGKNLDWFFNDVLSTNKTIDLRLSGIKHTGFNYQLKVTNKKGFKSPFEINGLQNGKIITTTKSEGIDGIGRINIQCESCDHFEIDTYHNIPDIDRRNNSIRTKGLFKKVHPVAVRLLPKFGTEKFTNIHIIPTVGWNEYNNWMAGLTFYNKFLPVKKIEYSLTTFYGFGDQQIAGTGNLCYNLFNRKGAFDFIGFKLGARRFAYLNDLTREGLTQFRDVTLHYNRLEPSIDFSIRKKDQRSSIFDGFGLSGVLLSIEDVSLLKRVMVNDSVGYNITGVENKSYQTWRAFYQHKNSKALDPYSYRLQIEGNKNYGKISLTSKWKINYRESRKGVETRLFAGSFIYNNKNAETQYPFSLSSWDGQRDFWFDDFYFGRSEYNGILSQQMNLNDGGFKMNVPYARVTSWLAALNIKVALPGNLPLKLFFDAGTFKDAKNHIEIYNDQLLYDGGICVSLVNDILECYLPLLKSKGIKQFNDDHNISFKEQIRFVINLKSLNPFYLRNQLLFVQ